MPKRREIDRFLATDVPLDDIHVVGERRPVDDGAVVRLMNSIREVGLQTPVTVRTAEVPEEVGSEELYLAFALVAGGHRLEAYRRLGFERIPAVIRECSEAEAELWEIDENLCRAELSPSDRARQTARRKVIYEELHSETKAPVAGAVGSNRVQGNATANLATASFAGATASATGSSERAVRRDAERGEKVIQEVLDMIRDTKLDTGTYLDRIKNFPPNDQVRAARRDLAIERKKEREPAQAALPATRAPKEPREEPLSRKDRRGLELTIKEARSSVKEFHRQLQDLRAENAKLRDERDTLRHELQMMKKRFGIPA